MGRHQNHFQHKLIGRNKMKLILQKNQKQGMGKTKYILELKVELTDEENENVKKYKVGNTIIYSNVQEAEGLLKSVASRIAGTQFTVNDLVNGKKIEMKDFFEMLDMEEIVKETCKTFKIMLEAMANFGGDEVIDY